MFETALIALSAICGVATLGLVTVTFLALRYASRESQQARDSLTKTSMLLASQGDGARFDALYRTAFPANGDDESRFYYTGDAQQAEELRTQGALNDDELTPILGDGGPR